MKLVFATNNLHKLQEVRNILPPDIEIIGLKEVGFLQDIDETGETLEANSLLKAQAVYHWLSAESTRVPVSDITGVFADDTGLEIEALGGLPGVRTARWAGEPACDSRNRQKALSELDGKTNRSARFRTVVTLIRNGSIAQVEGIVKGKMALSECGTGGFGYDPLFIPDGYDRTFAELPAETKNTISHRARAMQALCKIL